MRWSKVRKLVHESFAYSVRGRVQVNVTNAERRGKPWRDDCTQGSISVDGRMIAHSDPHHSRRLSLSLPDMNAGMKEYKPLLIVEPLPGQKVPKGAQTGSFLDLTDACWEYLHSSLNDSLRSRDPFVSSLAVLNAKVGRTRLKRAMAWDLHPLTRAMLEFRLQAELDARSTAAAAA